MIPASSPAAGTRIVLWRSMRAHVVLLLIASIPLGHFMAERPAKAWSAQIRGEDGRDQIPLVVAQPSEAGPLFYRKADGSSTGDASLPGGSLAGASMRDDRPARLVVCATAMLLSSPVIPELRLRI